MSDTLKKSMASQDQANQLQTGSGLRSEFRPSLQGRGYNSPREEETPLRPSKASQDLPQRSRSLHLLSLQNEVSQEIWGHQSTPPNANVNDTLEGKREVVGGLLVKRLWIETWHRFWRMRIWRG